VRLDEGSFEVVGVFPAALSLLLGDAEVLTPLAASPSMDRGEHYLGVVARLAPGATLDEARDELRAMAAWQSETFPEDRDWSAKLTPIGESLIGGATERAGGVLLAAAGLLLFMACVNVSSLLLARASTRREEMGVRLALGAGRTRLARQLLTESGVLAAAGAGLGLLGAWWALPVVRGLVQGRIPRIEDAALDPQAVLWACALAAGATLLFGSAPILALRRSMASAGRSRGRGGAGGGARRTLVALQVGASLVLLLGTGLLFRSFMALTRVDPGFDADGTVAVRLLMPDGAWSWQERGPLVQAIVERVEEVPGVVRAGATSVDPFSGMALANFVARQDRLPDRAADFQPIQWRAVTPGFFEAMAMELQGGRVFRNADRGDALSPVVIDAGLARRLWSDPADAVGEILVWGDPGGSRLRVLGVVEPLRDVALAQEPDPMVYRLHQEIPWATMTLVARVRPGVDGVAESLRRAVADAVPGLPVPEVRSLQDHVERGLAEPRFNLVLLGAFAGIGWILALVGLYGLTAFEVRQRFREIGIRLSLGARPSEIRRRIVRERLVVAAVGGLGGAAAAFFLTRLLSGLLYEVRPTDPATWLAAISLLTGTVIAAAWIPSRQATRVEPRDVLSGE
jgi:predicted permease